MKCPNCGNNLIFSPDKQSLICKSCDSSFDPKRPLFGQKNKDVKIAYAEEQKITQEENQYVQQETWQDTKTLNLIKFNCNSCGAELLGTYQTSALGFCPYCGGESILQSKLNTTKPNLIIPFHKTKEECHQDYYNMIKNIPFVPKELKDTKNIKEIRGIYIPYNLYRLEHNGNINAEYNYTQGDYTYYHGISGQVQSDINIPIDGSVQLDDIIGAKIFPYIRELEIPFNEKFLATYYVELPDVDDREYGLVLQREAINMEMEALKKYTKGRSESECTNKNTKALSEVQFAGKQIILAPAYFVTYRNKDRVCYTVVPGFSTTDAAIGKKKRNRNVDIKSIAYSEVPVDITKYTITMVVASLLLWLTMTFLPVIPTFNNNTMLIIISILSVIGLILQSLSYKLQIKKLNYFCTDSRITPTSLMNKASKPLLTIIRIAVSIISSMCIAVSILGSFSALKIRLAEISLLPIGSFILGTIFIIVDIMGASKYKIKIKWAVLMYICTIVASAFAIIAKLVFLVDEIVYPIMMIVTIPMAICYINLIRLFNVACTRPVPQFTREGGHNEAK